MDAGRGGIEMPNSSAGSSRGFIFWLQIVYMALLLVVAFLYGVYYPQWQKQWNLPASLGPVPFGVAWFGALGAAFISLTGVFDHANDWDPSYKYWHWARPIVGAVAGSVVVLIMQAGILAVGSASAKNNTFYYIVAFLVAYREETFRELIKRAVDVVIGPGTAPAAPVVTGMTPATGPVAGGTVVTVNGSGLSNVRAVSFGTANATFRVVSDGQLSITSPAGSAPGVVDVVLQTRNSKVTAGQFTYT
jgi:hypothetical protein